jgi:hypothetical protein
LKEEEDSAGGMSYRTMKEIDTFSIIKYLEGYNERSSTEIFEKNKEYYIASADKTIARLELARIRLKHANLSGEDNSMLLNRLSNGLNWLKTLKKNIRKANNNSEFQKVISYKKWHSVKLLPSGVEGYLITNSIQRNIDGIKNKLPESESEDLRNAKTHNQKAKLIFLKLLNLDVSSDFKAAEKSRIKAYNEAVTAQRILKEG